jgi:N6-L-threonylcarbamoyladenine synthase/protein kinase Bud32
LQDVLINNDDGYIEKLFNMIGSDVSNIHEAGIIHGDLTTANILVSNDEPVFIDFGLGKYSDLYEDKGTDLLVFKKSLTTIVPEKSEKLFNYFLDGYDDDNIIKKIEEIEQRGRYL